MLAIRPSGLITVRSCSLAMVLLLIWGMLSMIFFKKAVE
jgi:hypothetical protein